MLVRDREEAAKGNVERKKGMKSDGEWELSKKEKRSRIGMGEQGVDVEDDVRTVLWKNESD